MKNFDILYEDNHIIVVVKPYNILSQSDNTKDCDMLTLIKAYLKEKYNKPFNVYLGLVHRLDRPTMGIMVFAKTSKAASRLSKQIISNEFKKKYMAVVCGKMSSRSGKLTDYIKKLDDNSSIITDINNGKKSVLTYDVIACHDDLSLLSINLETGRHHQIRVQFANIGHPLYGDQRYGIQNKKQLALCAYYLSFLHPITKERFEFSIKPSGSCFNLFEEDIC